MDIESPDELLQYLRASGRIGADEVPDIRVLAGGVSNRTVLVTRASGEAWVLKQALAKLRVKADWFADPARVHREALGIRWLGTLAPAGTITPLVFEDEPNHLLAMQAVPQPHENWKMMLLAGRLQPDHLRQFAELLATIHRRSTEAGPALAGIFADRSFFEALRIEPYYIHAAGKVRGASAFLQRLVDDTRRCAVAIVHGDYSPKNILVHDDRLVLLDHEVIHWGDPAFDLGFSLTHLLSKAHHLPAHRQHFADAARMYWKTYRTMLGELPWSGGLEQRAVRHTLACLLARVAGRSPLEYLTAGQRCIQESAAVELMAAEPPSIDALVELFIERIETCQPSGS